MYCVAWSLRFYDPTKNGVIMPRCSTENTSIPSHTKARDGPKAFLYPCVSSDSVVLCVVDVFCCVLCVLCAVCVVLCVLLMNLRQ